MATKIFFQTGEGKASILRLLPWALIDTKAHEKTPVTFHYLFAPTLEELLQDINTHGKNSHRENIGAPSPEANHFGHPVDPHVKNLC